MGSLTSRPSVPSQPQVVYTPPAYEAPVPSTPERTPQQIASQARTESLLQRGRGAFGNITTSFRGLLGLANDGGQKKTLLGE